MAFLKNPYEHDVKVSHFPPTNWKEKFIIWPHYCFFSKKRMMPFKTVMRGSRMCVAIGRSGIWNEAVYANKETFWLTRSEFTLQKLKGVL